MDEDRLKRLRSICGIPDTGYVPPKHPAVYTDSFLPIFAVLLQDRNLVLDPFAGTGKLAMIKNYGFTGTVVCNEIEPEWANSPYPVDHWHIGDASNMDWAEDESFDAICTSPTYGNRMADHFEAQDNSRRITYRHYLGRPLHDQNTGRMQWGQSYKQKHIEVYKECTRILKIGGLFILNISDHIRAGKVIPVTDWHRSILINLGLSFVDEVQIQTPRMKFGENSGSRVSHETIMAFEKHQPEV